jgi:hypothetical protein
MLKQLTPARRDGRAEAGQTLSGVHQSGFRNSQHQDPSTVRCWTRDGIGRGRDSGGMQQVKFPMLRDGRRGGRCIKRRRGERWQRASPSTTSSLGGLTRLGQGIAVALPKTRRAGWLQPRAVASPARGEGDDHGWQHRLPSPIQTRQRLSPDVRRGTGGCGSRLGARHSNP